MIRGRAKQIRKFVEQLASHLTDAEALDVVGFFQNWEAGKAYVKGDRVRCGEVLYCCLQDHTAQSDWMPDTAHSLWARVLIPDPTQIPDWEQPDSTNPYAKGDKVRHNGKVWVSTIDGNVWEPGAPGVYVWTEVQE
ncbi:MAG: hypothetical protein IKO68_00045 [Oscillospiraceae bacterium]|nr:hypothetical protein [Oscillospiraceae bacterium]MBR4654985.1 hypothetical protein [Oscillospiraceae bacterium]